MNILWLSLAFVAGFLFVFGLNLIAADFMRHRREAVRRRLEEEEQALNRERARGSLAKRELYELAAEGYVDLSQQETITDRVGGMLTQAGIHAKPRDIILFSIVLALVPAALVFLWIPNWILAFVVGIVGATLPYLFVSMKRAQRRKQLVGQMPDAFELMARVLRSGQTIAQALRSVSEEFSRPISEEFGLCWEQQNLGLSPDASYFELARRTGVLEMKIFVVALAIHRTTGGNLASLLEKLANVIRQRQRIRGHIQALTAEGRFQAYILMALPLVLLAVICFLNPGYAQVLLDNPWLLIGMLISECIGGLWMRSIVNFDF